MRYLIVVLCFVLPAALMAQDTLPQFSVTTRGNNRNLISWVNNYPVITQLNIQRSSDSLKGFKTILTVPDPTIPQNGFVDTKAPAGKNFYRLFILLDSGKYEFGKARAPVLDTSSDKQATTESNNTNTDRRVIVSSSLDEKETEKIKEKLENPKELKEVKEAVKEVKKHEPEKFFAIKRRDSVIALYPQKYLKRFRDSVITKTKDTLLVNSFDTVTIKPFFPKPVYKPSLYVFTEKDGNVSISLPQALQKKYSIKFFEDDSTDLFEIKHVKRPMLTLDKSNFHHAGWFRFELYENGTLMEKHRFFIQKDF